MAPRVQHFGMLLLALVTLAGTVLLLAPQLTGTAAAGACNRWGGDNPSRLSHPEARKAILCLIDRERHSHGRGHLDRNKRLQRAAQNHSEYMRGHGCFDHDCPGEKSTLGRLQGVNYIHSGLSRWAYGENIAWGLKARGTPREIVDGWMHSSAHRANILSGSFKDVGVGFVQGSPYRKRANGGIYTVDFGLRAG